MNVTLENRKKSKTFEIENRSVYVASGPKQMPVYKGPAFGSAEWFSMNIKSGFVPTMLGFALMMLIVLLARRATGKNIN